MARLVIKNGYIKGGSAKAASHLSHLVKYIATRDGVEKIKRGHEHWYATKRQQQLINELLRRFPDSKESLEYEDYLVASTRENASGFITITLEQNIHKIGDNQKYLDYIANRPRVEKIDTHGLFTSGDVPLVLSQVADEIANHKGNVWTPIISLRREDGERFGFESTFAWKALLSSKVIEIADGLKIHPDNLKWYAAFHDESHHPHVHMICYSTNPNEGYLTKTGIRKIKSALANEIFKQELIPLYGQKTVQREALKEQAAATMREMILQMKSATIQNEKVEQLITHLADRLQYTTGKKQYGYLKANLKNVVDEIVDELARDERVSCAYEAWKETKGLIGNMYSHQLQEDMLLSKCDDFKSIRNMVIDEAVLLMQGDVTFEGEPSTDTLPTELPDSEMDTELPATDDAEPLSTDDNDFHTQIKMERAEGKMPPATCWWWSDEYKKAKQHLYGDEEKGIPKDFTVAFELFLAEAEKNNPLAMCDLARMLGDSLIVATEIVCAEGDMSLESCWWYAKALAEFHLAESKEAWKYTEYRIGKLYAAGLGTEQDYETAAHWLTLSADEGYKYAQYSLSGLYYHGNGVEQNHQKAFKLYLASAKQKFPYASFELGKMLRDGIGCEKNDSESQQHFADAFHGFTTLEQQSHDDKLQYRLGWMLQSGIGTEKDELKAKVYFEKSASVGNSFACYQLAKMILADESSTTEDIQKALAFFEKSAESDNPFAQYALGKLYEDGEHTQKDITRAARLYEKSAKSGNEYAAYRLGKLYFGGEGIVKDVGLAIRWFNLSAEKNNPFAQYALGTLYLKGEDVQKDISKAVAYLKSATEQGNEFAEYRLGKLYLTGEDIPKDIESAIEYLTAVADKGNQYAQYTLGKLYLMGKDIPQDKETAIKWFTLSAAQGNIYAQFFLDNMDKFQNPSAVLAATRLLHHMSRVFADNTPPAKSSVGQMIDRKLAEKIRRKKQAQGHAKDDHEQTMYWV